MKELLNKISKNINWNIIIDNARIHHYLKFKKFINKHNNIKIIYNVPYSPESNPIEQVFSEVKNIIKNKSITNKNIINIITNSFNSIKKRNLNKYFIKSINYY